MKKIGFAVAMLALTQMACIITSDSDEGRFTVSWDVTDNAQPASCADVGAAAVETIATDQLDPNTPPIAYADIFRDCDGWAGTTAPMPFSDYTVAWAILNGADLRLSPFSEPAPVDVILSVDLQALPLATFDF